MDASSTYPFSILPFIAFLLLLFCTDCVDCTAFTILNNCSEKVWPGILSNSGSNPLNTTGFELAAGDSRSFQAPTGWSGRFWARTGCSFDDSGHGSCDTGDCGSGRVECNGAGATPPATLAEFAITGPSTTQDFYDVSLVDGYNLPMVVQSHGGTGRCDITGCVVDVNRRCPAELRAAEGKACRSACEAFGKPAYCCSEAYASPATCRPSVYSEVFKSACPKSYSYAYDDATSTFTCSGADYTITFCPELNQRKRLFGGSSTAKKGGLVSQSDDSWLATLAMGDATTYSRVSSSVHVAFLPMVVILVLMLP